MRDKVREAALLLMDALCLDPRLIGSGMLPVHIIDRLRAALDEEAPHPAPALGEAEMRASFLAWIRDDGYLVPDAVTDIEWDDEDLPVYYTRYDGERHYLDGEWHAWQAATLLAARKGAK